MVNNDRKAHGNQQIQLLQGQAEILELIATGGELDHTLSRLALVVERCLNRVYCTVQVSDPDRGERLIAPHRESFQRDQAPSGHENASADPAGKGRSAKSPEREQHVPPNFVCAWSQPIDGSRSETPGVIVVHYEKDRDLALNEIQCVRNLSRLAGIAIAQERRERTRRLAQQRFVSLARNVPGVVYQLLVAADGRLRFTYVSEGVSDLFGITPEEAVADAEALLGCYEPAHRHAIQERLYEASETLTPWAEEAWITALDGGQRFARDIAHPQRQADGSVLWDGIILDATRTKQAESQLIKAKEEAEVASQAKTRLLTQLRSTNQRFASLVASVPGVVYQRKVTPDGDIHYTYISDGVKDLFGITPEEVLADSQVLFDCHGPEYRKDFRERLLAASKTLSMWDVEAQIVTANGECKYTHAIARPHRQSDGSVLWDGIILDATRIKRAEMELRRAKERAESSSRAKTEFLATIGHELRTPLNAIIGFSEMIKDERSGPVADPKTLDYAMAINSSGEALLEQINDILEFTRFDSGRLELAEGDVSLGNLLNHVALEAKPFADRSGVDLDVGEPEGLIILLGDQDRLKRMLWHLVANAIKFSKSGGRVEVKTSIDSGGRALIAIADDGIGMARSDIPRAHEAFTQLDGRLSRKFGGIGLGIPLATAIAKMHGASMNFQSESGRGTTVVVEFPETRVISNQKKNSLRESSGQ